MHDQADELRQLVRQSALASAQPGPAPQLIVISGGKGGVGVTTMAVNLAVACAQQGRRTVLVDADLQHEGVAQLCQIPEQGSILDVLNGRCGIQEVLERGPAGIQVLPGAWATSEIVEFSAAAHERFIAELQRVSSQQADVIIIDAGSDRDPMIRRFWQAAERVLVVTTPEPAAIMEAYAAIKVMLSDEDSVRVEVLVNQTPDAATATDVQRRISEACRRFLGLRAAAAGFVPADATVADAAHSGRPFVLHSPRCEAARAVERVAEAFRMPMVEEKKSA